ncbi:DUF1175 family protein [Deinococcus arenicola]|uniref:DUF1175 family protein n=1 Tax=Deinococcus arenicola TaxID=2994950 RepID=A0ABU4DSM4_9DEIO|nr:DUF1175 family protein [Deinococcus sp. ZS9-10]MDV6375432.1 DUF1175 family protein [Deinococcus sp. ZS9-10]
MTRQRIFLRLCVLVCLVLGGGVAQSPAQNPPPSAADHDRDGYPDAAELVGQDRVNFADWFAAIAESQYYGMNADWKAGDRDCGGLLRYAFINALMPHDSAWFAKFKYLPRPNRDPVQAFSYPMPIISRSVFRVAGGAYQAGDIQAGKLVGRTTVQYLSTYSMVRVSREMTQAKRGDMLIFIRPGLRSYHSMVYLGGSKVVYHTGASPAEGGEVRLLTVQSLLRHAERAFHPAGSNPNFLGVYRWKVVN